MGWQYAVPVRTKGRGHSLTVTSTGRRPAQRCRLRSRGSGKLERHSERLRTLAPPTDRTAYPAPHPHPPQDFAPRPEGPARSCSETCKSACHGWAGEPNVLCRSVPTRLPFAEDSRTHVCRHAVVDCCGTTTLRALVLSDDSFQYPSSSSNSPSHHLRQH